MSRISTIVFDVGGVLVFNSNPHLLARLRAKMGAPCEAADLLAYIRSSGIGQGTATLEDLFRRFSKEFDYKHDYEMFLSDWCCHFAPNESILNELPAIKNAYTVIICSNTNEGHWRHICSEYRLHELTERQVLSFEVGAEKPSDTMFAKLRESIRDPLSQCLFVDDTLENIVAAKRHGYCTLHYTGQSIDWSELPPE